MGGYVARVVGTEQGSGFDVAVNNDGNAFYATPCCGASAKGCDGYVGCRSCYAVVDSGLGGVPGPEWFAPQHRQRIHDFNDWMRQMILKAVGE